MKSVEKGRKFVVVGSHYSVNVSAIICVEVNGYKIKASIRACDPSSEKFLVCLSVWQLLQKDRKAVCT